MGTEEYYPYLLSFEQETYPQSAPIWFSEDDDTVVSNVISNLGDAPSDKNNVSNTS
jgi:hypothetical protein